MDSAFLTQLGSVTKMKGKGSFRQICCRRWHPVFSQKYWETVKAIAIRNALQRSSILALRTKAEERKNVNVFAPEASFFLTFLWFVFCGCIEEKGWESTRQEWLVFYTSYDELDFASSKWFSVVSQFSVALTESFTVGDGSSFWKHGHRRLHRSGDSQENISSGGLQQSTDTGNKILWARLS